MITKPMLAVEANIEELQYPVLASPKLDGIRCLVIDGKALSRTFKPIPNRHIRETIEKVCISGFDGEIIIPGANFNDVQSAVMSEDGTPEFTYAIFDYVTDITKAYGERLRDLYDVFPNHLAMSMIQPLIMKDATDLLRYEEDCLSQGFEGVMVRTYASPYKCGRSTRKEGYLLKIKRFSDAEARVTGFVEELTNTNEAKKNDVGTQKRSKIKANLIPNGKLGALKVKDVNSNVDFEIGTGFSDKERQEIWDNQSKLIGAIVTYKFQPHGVKEKPRCPTFKGFRSVEDM